MPQILAYEIDSVPLHYRRLLHLRSVLKKVLSLGWDDDGEVSWSLAQERGVAAAAAVCRAGKSEKQKLVLL